MAVQPSDVGLLDAEIISVKGERGAGHKRGDKLQIGWWDRGGLCGFFYHDIFSNLNPNVA